MSQHDYTVANDTFPNVRSDVNAALQALASENSGGSAPGTTFAYQFWADTGNGIMKRRNAANAGWVIGDTLAEAFVVAKSSAYTVLISDHQKIFTCTSTFELTLTAAATLGDGHQFGVRNDGTGVITINPNSSEQIDGATTIKLYRGESCVVFCSGSAFVTLGRSTGLVLIDQVAASSSALLPFTQGIDTSFDEFELHCSSLLTATDNVNLLLRVSQDGGATYKSGASDYAYTSVGQTDAGGVSGGGASTGAAYIQMGSSLSNTKGYSGRIRSFAPGGSSLKKMFSFEADYESSGATISSFRGAGVYKADATALNALAILASAGNIASGTVSLYGVRK